jgi:hypothetical protein
MRLEEGLVFLLLQVVDVSLEGVVTVSMETVRKCEHMSSVSNKARTQCTRPTILPER